MSEQSTYGKVIKRTGFFVSLDYGGVEVRLTETEYLKLRAIRSRPAEAHHGKEPIAIPLRPENFSGYHKTIYADLHGDAAAQELFGDGPWLKKNHISKKRRRAT